MRIFVSGLTAAALVSLSFAGCKTAGSENKPTNDEPATGFDTEAVEGGVKLMEDMAAIMRTNAEDCDKVAAELTPFFETNKDALLAFNALMESYSPEQRKVIGNAYMHRMADAMRPLMDVGMLCEDNENYNKAMLLVTPKDAEPASP